MSQGQQRRPDDQHGGPIKYGDLFTVDGELADRPVAPRDAAMMQTAETAMMGQTQRGGVAVVMQSAAARNERDGFIGHEDVNAATRDVGVSVTETDLPGRRVITEAVSGQVVGQYSQRGPVQIMTPPSTFIESDDASGDGITIGEALGATALTAGSKPVEWSDAAAIQAAEVRATGRTTIAPGGVAAAAQSAAMRNARTTKDEEKTKLGEVLADAASKLPADRPANRKDAEGVTGAEMRNDPYLTTHPYGVAASVAAAARINQKSSNNKQSPTL